MGQLPKQMIMNSAREIMDFPNQLAQSIQAGGFQEQGVTNGQKQPNSGNSNTSGNNGGSNPSRLPVKPGSTDNSFGGSPSRGSSDFSGNRPSGGSGSPQSENSNGVVTPNRGTDGGTVYVNSLGQLSTDGDAGFDPQKSFILKDKESNFDDDLRLPSNSFDAIKGIDNSYSFGFPDAVDAPLRGSEDLSEPVEPSEIYGSSGPGGFSGAGSNEPYLPPLTQEQKNKQLFTYPHNGVQPEHTGEFNKKLAEQSPKYPAAEVYSAIAPQPLPIAQQTSYQQPKAGPSPPRQSYQVPAASQRSTATRVQPQEQPQNTQQSYQTQSQPKQAASQQHRSQNAYAQPQQSYSQTQPQQLSSSSPQRLQPLAQAPQQSYSQQQSDLPQQYSQPSYSQPQNPQYQSVSQSQESKPSRSQNYQQPQAFSQQTRQQSAQPSRQYLQPSAPQSFQAPFPQSQQSQQSQQSYSIPRQQQSYAAQPQPFRAQSQQVNRRNFNVEQSSGTGESNEDYIKRILQDRNEVHSDKGQLVELIQRLFVPKPDERVIGADVIPSPARESYSFTYDGASSNNNGVRQQQNQQQSAGCSHGNCGHPGYRY